MKIDNTPTRATFGTEYPIEPQIVDTKNLLLTYSNRVIELPKKWETLENIHFNACKTKFDKDSKLSFAVVENCTFKKCTFVKCFFGSTKFENVSFHNCTFERTDFMRAQFINCNFTGCKFLSCTSWLVRFEKTVISSESFMQGVPFPIDNYDKNESKLLHYKFKHQKNRLDYAAELVKTATEKFDTNLIDQATYDHRRELQKYYWMKFKSKENYNGSNKTILWKRIKDSCLSCQIWIINILTNGGTSFVKVLLASFAFVFIIAPIIFNNIHSSISIGGEIESIRDMTYFQRLAIGAETILGFGYTSILPKTLNDKYFLVMLPMTGILLIGLFLHTLIKKVFR